MERALQQSTRRIAAEIQRYCTAHPGARDTLEGVMWWVQLQRNEDFKCRIAEAVEWLVKHGMLERNELGDGSVVFGVMSKDGGDRD
jgi:hypothetical protein